MSVKVWPIGPRRIEANGFEVRTFQAPIWGAHFIFESIGSHSDHFGQSIPAVAFWMIFAALWYLRSAGVYDV